MTSHGWGWVAFGAAGLSLAAFMLGIASSLTAFLAVVFILAFMCLEIP